MYAEPFPVLLNKPINAVGRAGGVGGKIEMKDVWGRNDASE